MLDMKVYRNKQGQLHCSAGPARIDSDGFEEYWVNNKRHREDGPAVIRPSGFKEWWVSGIQVTEEQFKDKKALALLLITC